MCTCHLLASSQEEQTRRLLYRTTSRKEQNHFPTSWLQFKCHLEPQMSSARQQALKKRNVPLRNVPTRLLVSQCSIALLEKLRNVAHCAMLLPAFSTSSLGGRQRHLRVVLLLERLSRFPAWEEVHCAQWKGLLVENLVGRKSSKDSSRMSRSSYLGERRAEGLPLREKAFSCSSSRESLKKTRLESLGESLRKTRLENETSLSKTQLLITICNPLTAVFDQISIPIHNVQRLVLKKSKVFLFGRETWVLHPWEKLLGRLVLNVLWEEDLGLHSWEGDFGRPSRREPPWEKV